MESIAAEGPSEIQMHAVAEPVSRVAFPRKPPDAMQSMGMDVSESKRERQEQVQHTSRVTAVVWPQSSAMFCGALYTVAYTPPQTAPPWCT